jgi:hypothetical protein
MKLEKIKKIAFGLMIVYILVCYLFPELIRLRYFLVISGGLVLINILDLKTLVITRFLTALALIGLFFFKIIPTPYLYLNEKGLPMSVSIMITVVFVFVATSIAAFLVGKVVDLLETKD